MATNLNEIIKNTDFNHKLDIIIENLEKIKYDRTIGRKYYFDINHKFTENLEECSINKQGKELTLALEITRLQRFGTKNYYFYNINTKLNSDIHFRQFFKEYCNLGKIRNRNYYKNNNTATTKQMIKGTNDLVIKQLITQDTANKYFEYLEKVVGEICNKEIQNKDIVENEI